MQPADVRTITRRTRRVEGWFSAEAAALFGLLDEAQRAAGVEGHLFEIGVHHGRSAVLLSQLARPGERLGVCDLFGEQTQNVSASGSGNRAIFEGNMAALAPGFDRLDVFATASDQLTPDRIGGPYRLFHIDGGHLREEALSDLRLAAGALHERGAIVVDDPVQRGLARGHRGDPLLPRRTSRLRTSDPRLQQAGGRALRRARAL